MTFINLRQSDGIELFDCSVLWIASKRCIDYCVYFINQDSSPELWGQVGACVEVPCDVTNAANNTIDESDNDEPADGEIQEEMMNLDKMTAPDDDDDVIPDDVIIPNDAANEKRMKRPPKRSDTG